MSVDAITSTHSPFRIGVCSPYLTCGYIGCSVLGDMNAEITAEDSLFPDQRYIPPETPFPNDLGARATTLCPSLVNFRLERMRTD